MILAAYAQQPAILAPAGGKRHHLFGREPPLGQDVEHLAAHIAGGADDGDLVIHD
jgi:hypothetical protein